MTCPSCGHDGLPPLVCEHCGHRWYATPAPLGPLVADGCPACHHPDHDPGSCEWCPRCELHTDDAFAWVQRIDPDLIATPAPLDLVPLATQVAVTRWEIDVERLARALEPHWGPSYLPGLHDVTIHGETVMACAAAIAAAYAEEEG